MKECQGKNGLSYRMGHFFSTNSTFILLLKTGKVIYHNCNSIFFSHFPQTGPALWAYNDAVFTDDDFENITKLSGATKEPKTDKIGRLVLHVALFLARLALTDLSGLRISCLRFRRRETWITFQRKNRKNACKQNILFWTLNVEGCRWGEITTEKSFYQILWLQMKDELCSSPLEFTSNDIHV